MKHKRIPWEEVERIIKETFEMTSVYLVKDDGEEVGEYPDYVEE